MDIHDQTLTALHTFFESNDFYKSLVTATRLSWKGEAYMLELFTDGTYRTMEANEIGIHYETTGLLMRIPPFDDSDMRDATKQGMGEEEYFQLCFDIDKYSIQSDMEEIVTYLLEEQKKYEM